MKEQIFKSDKSVVGAGLAVISYTCEVSNIHRYQNFPATLPALFLAHSHTAVLPFHLSSEDLYSPILYSQQIAKANSEGALESEKLGSKPDKPLGNWVP